MPQPILSWWNHATGQQMTNWVIGTVDAGGESNPTTIQIWNNRGGSTDVSDCLDCTITTKDIAGGNTGELVLERWINVKVDSMGEGGWTAIGGDVVKSIKAETAPAGVISGKANSGNPNTDKANYALVTLIARPSATATAGNVDFLLRVSYRYI